MKQLTAEEITDKLASTEKYCAEQNVTSAIQQAKLAHSILDEITSCLHPEISENEVKEFALQSFANHKIERTWHPPYVRFGQNTLLTFMDKAKENRILQKDDIAFIDIGIVKNGIEGDAGKTVAFGNNATFESLANISKKIFDEAVIFWKQTNPVGTELYEYIYGLAEKSGVKWNLDPAGHLIGAFPHRGWKRGINHFPDKIENGKWILEIQIRHPQLPIGSFYEDLLYV